MQAVVKIGGSQYLVAPGQELLVDHLLKPLKKLIFNEVLLTIDGQDIEVGQPFVPGVAVVASFLDDAKGEKIRVAKFKAKSRYRKAPGFRAVYSRLKIESIGSPPSSAAAEVKPARKPRQKKSV